MRARSLSIVAVCLVFSAQAALAGGFIGISAGQADTEIETPDSLRFSADDSAWKIWGGYDIVKPFGIEAGYADLGSYTERIANVDYNGDSSAIYAAGVGQVTFAKLVTLFGKVGIAGYNETQRVAEGIPSDEPVSKISYSSRIWTRSTSKPIPAP